MVQRKFKVGTRIEIKAFGLDSQPRWEAARIARTQRCMLPLPNGYVPIKYDIDGAVLLCHESGFRVVDNGAP